MQLLLYTSVAFHDFVLTKRKIGKLLPTNFGVHYLLEFISQKTKQKVTILNKCNFHVLYIYILSSVKPNRATIFFNSSQTCIICQLIRFWVHPSIRDCAFWWRCPLYRCEMGCFECLHRSSFKGWELGVWF